MFESEYMIIRDVVCWKERVVTEKTEVLRFMFFCSCGLRIGWHTIMWLYVPRRAEENLCTHYETLELNLSCGCLSHSRAMEPGTTMNNLDFYESSRWCIVISIHFMRFKHSPFILSSICTSGERSNSSLQIWCAISEWWDGAKKQKSKPQIISTFICLSFDTWYHSTSVAGSRRFVRQMENAEHWLANMCRSSVLKMFAWDGKLTAKVLCLKGECMSCLWEQVQSDISHSNYWWWIDTCRCHHKHQVGSNAKCRFACLHFTCQLIPNHGPLHLFQWGSPDDDTSSPSRITSYAHDQNNPDLPIRNHSYSCWLPHWWQYTNIYKHIRSVSKRWQPNACWCTLQPLASFAPL